MFILPSPSRYPPVRRKPPVVDLRREITAWGALVWAYADQNVRLAAAAPSETARYNSNGLAMMRLGQSGVRDERADGISDVHPDAFVVDTLVANWFDEWPDWRRGVAIYAESRRLPPAAHDLPRWRIIGPDLKPNGDVRVIWKGHGGKHAAWICPLVCEGFDDEAIERHRQFMVMFDALLDVMKGLVLDRYMITSKGA